ncbi:hypothetical protein ACI6Q5_01935 [Xanthomonas codiaei]|uniref:Uncharacterized protein n=1 Tax=Xanthomonas codiaei TaxID=56463 RepID=A0ABW9MGJ5_9XANT|nr:hypothetical protein [Xanthomonas codiaei]
MSPILPPDRTRQTCADPPQSSRPDGLQNTPARNLGQAPMPIHRLQLAQMGSVLRLSTTHRVVQAAIDYQAVLQIIADASHRPLVTGTGRVPGCSALDATEVDRSRARANDLAAKGWSRGCRSTGSACSGGVRDCNTVTWHHAIQSAGHHPGHCGVTPDRLA